MGVTRVINIRNGEPYDVLIDRRTIYGNPFRIGRDGNRDEVCDKHEKYLQERVKKDLYFRMKVLELIGKVMGCWCKPLRCHGDNYVKYLEGME